MLSYKKLKSHNKAKIMLLNKDLSDFCKKKQLKSAIKRFNQAVRKGLKPDIHSYSNLMNCYVRCGQVAGAMASYIF